MSDDTSLVQQFEAQRPRLRSVAYRILGSSSEADDAVQEAWLRLSRTDPDAIDNLGAWLTTVVARICLNMIRSRRTRGDAADGDFTPDPIVWLDEGPGPEEETLLADAVGLALVVVQRLAPAERLAFVLHDLFGVPFEEIAP